MFCNKCGSTVPDGTANCPKCGSPLGGGTQVPYGTNGSAAKASFFQQEAASINFIGLIAAVVGLVCTFLAKVVATVEVWGMKESASEGIIGHYGWLMIFLFVVTAVLMFLRKDHIALVPAAINTLFCIFKMIQELTTNVSEYEAMGFTCKISLNIFYWLMIVAAVVTVVAVFLGKKKNA